MPFASLGPAEGKADRRRAELREVFQNITALARKEQVGLLLICGDLYEHGYVRKATINFISEEFQEIPEIKVVIIPGNHDPYLPGSYYRTFEWPDNVHILSGEEAAVEFEELHVRIYGGLSRPIADRASRGNYLRN